MSCPLEIMSQEIISREVVVGIRQGLHARPADLLAREARKWHCLLYTSDAADE